MRSEEPRHAGVLRFHSLIALTFSRLKTRFQSLRLCFRSVFITLLPYFAGNARNSSNDESIFDHIVSHNKTNFLNDLADLAGFAQGYFPFGPLRGHIYPK
jgi:hypothetical protein